ncbi:hypothetical protein [Streptomyces sp. AC558_RSS880]|nr:hypothetical protein [Streptomyces sp. AC558_RSS880]
MAQPDEDDAVREGFDPADHHQPDDIVQLLAPTWDVLINETHPPAAR